MGRRNGYRIRPARQRGDQKVILRLDNVIVRLLFFSIIATVWSTSLRAQGNLQQQVDSIFVIASSGEVKYLDLVQPAIDELVGMGEQVVPILIEKLTTKSARERLTIIQIFKEIGSPTLPYLIPALSRPEDIVVSRVCWALGDVGDAAAVSALVEVTGHRSWQVRENAIDALGKLKDNSADEPILSALQDSIGQVRKAAVVALGRLKADDAVRPMVSVLGDSFYGARLSAMEALLKLDTAATIIALSDSMISANHLVGDLGCRVLGSIGTDEARDVLLKQAAVGDARRRVSAAVAVVKSDPLDHCGFQQQLLAAESDRLNLIKIQSAISSVGNESQEH